MTDDASTNASARVKRRRARRPNPMGTDGMEFVERLIPLHPVTQYEGATQLPVGERVVGRESALCLGLSRVAPLRA